MAVTVSKKQTKLTLLCDGGVSCTYAINPEATEENIMTAAQSLSTFITHYAKDVIKKETLTLTSGG